MKNKGFTLIEVLISLALFAYILSALMILFFQFSKNLNHGTKCSTFSLVVLQKMLTEAREVQISSTSEDVSFKYYENEDQSLRTSGLLDYCGNTPILFTKSFSTTSLIYNSTKCLQINYPSSTSQTVCAFK